MTRLSIAIALVFLPGCKQIFELDEPARVDAFVVEPPPIGCTADAECPVTASHCAIPQGYCVACRDNADCTDLAQSLCRPDTLTCTGCLRHADCPSAACVPSGTCGDDATVIYVDANGVDNPTCWRTAPCKTIAHALTLATSTRDHIKLSGALSVASRINFSFARIVWLADPGTTLTGLDDPIADLQSGTLEIFDLAIACGGTQRAFRVQQAAALRLTRTRIESCEKLAVEGNGGFLILDRAVIANNPGGGIETDQGGFVITNSFFTRNGNNGAITIGANTASPQNRFEFNTVVDNMATTGSTSANTGGVECRSSNLMAAPNNIIARNVGYHSNTSGGCDFSGSIVTTDVGPLAFVSADTPPFDYHLTAPSMAVDDATATTVNVDADGEPRPFGPASDVGADEFRP